MTAATTTTAAASDELIERVRLLAVEGAAWPSKRAIMRACRVGSPRAEAALAALRDEGFDPAPAPTLTIVPDAPETQAERTQEHSEPAAPDADTGASGEAAEAATEGAEIAGDGTAGNAAGAVTPARVRRVPRWPLLIIALGAFVSIWGGWVGLGELAGFGPVRLLPGIADSFVINSAITLPLGVEAYAAFAMWTWLAPADAQVSRQARRFACWSSIAALALGVFGQAVYHLLITNGVTVAPGPVVVFVSCLPVLVLGAGAALAHLIGQTDEAAR